MSLPRGCGEKGSTLRLQELWATLVRRWYLVVAAVVLTVGAGIGAWHLLGPTYEAKAAILMVPPGTTIDRKTDNSADGNPFLALGGLSQARDIVIQAVTSQTTFEDLCTRKGDTDYLQMQAELCKSRPGVKFEVTPDFTSNAPIVLVTVKADTSTNATVALTTMAEEIPTALADLQSEFKLRARALITSMPIVIDEQPMTVHKTQIRAAIAAGGGVMAVSLLAIALIDGLVGPRRAPSLQRASDDSDDPDAAHPLPETSPPDDFESKVDADTAEAPAVEDTPRRATISTRQLSAEDVL